MVAIVPPVTFLSKSVTVWPGAVPPGGFVLRQLAAEAGSRASSLSFFGGCKSLHGRLTFAIADPAPTDHR